MNELSVTFPMRNPIASFFERFFIFEGNVERIQQTRIRRRHRNVLRPTTESRMLVSELPRRLFPNLNGRIDQTLLPGFGRHDAVE
jgi:hypothetical protein